jgi:hypothetical protein
MIKPVDGDSRHGEDAVAAHRAETVVMEEEDACVSADTGRFGQHRAPHAATPRLADDGCAQVARVLLDKLHLASIVLPGGEGNPSTMRRNGPPAACASIVRIRV